MAKRHLWSLRVRRLEGLAVAPLVVIVFLGALAAAQTPPSLGYVYPPAVQVGTTIDVQLGGYDLTPDTQFFVHDSRVKLTTDGNPGPFLVPKPPYWFGEKGRSAAFAIPREIAGELQVAADAPPGLVRWQAANANGASGTSIIYVSDMPETVENRVRNRPQLLDALPIGVSGRLSRIAEVDRYRIVAPSDGPVSVELFCRRLGTNVNALVQVRDESGRTVADAADTQGLDVALTFHAKKRRSYEIVVHDIDFRGNAAFVYRLEVREGPRVVATIPAFLRRGHKAKVKLLGDGAVASVIGFAEQEISVPSSPDRTHYQLAYPWRPDQATMVRLPLSDLRERTGLTDGGSRPMKLAVPEAVTGLLQKAPRHEYLFSATKGQPLQVDLMSREIGGDVDIRLSIHDSAGKQLVESDDLPGTTDAGLLFAAPEDGEYSCRVAGLPNAAENCMTVYRLAIYAPKADFQLTAPQTLVIPIGGKGELAVKATRIRGFEEPIALNVEGLPDGITVQQPLLIPKGKNELKLAFSSDEKSSSLARMIRVSGSARIDGRMVHRIVECAVAGNLSSRDPRRERTNSILLVPTMKPLFALRLVDGNRQRTVHRGTTCRAEFRIEREEGCHGDIFIMMAAKQGRHRQGITAPVVRVPADKDRALFLSYMPEWLETDRTTRMVAMGMGTVTDPKGNTRYLTRNADARITMILEGALLKINHRAKELTVGAGESFEIPFQLSRSPKLQLPVTVRLRVPPELKGIVGASPSEVSSTLSEGKLKVETHDHPTLTGVWRLKLEATALQDGKWPVVSLAEIPVAFKAPFTATEHSKIER